MVDGLLRKPLSLSLAGAGVGVGPDFDGDMAGRGYPPLNPHKAREEEEDEETKLHNFK